MEVPLRTFHKRDLFRKVVIQIFLYFSHLGLGEFFGFTEPPSIFFLGLANDSFFFLSLKILGDSFDKVIYFHDLKNGL